MSKFDLAIVIPFLNESENIDRLLRALDSSLENIPEKVQVIFVDDGSQDNSVELLCAYKPKAYSRKIVKLSKNFGSHAAIRAGLLNSDADYSTFLAADLQEDPLSAIQFYRVCVSKDVDILMLYRKTYNTSIFVKIFSAIYTFLLRILVSKDFPNKNISNFFICNKVVKVLNQNIIRNSSIFLQIYFLGFKKEFLPYEQSVRAAGKSKWTFSMKLKLLIDSLISFSYVPLRMITVIGFLLFFLGFAYIVIILISALTNPVIQSGWPTLMSILLMGFGFTNIALGITSEYLWRILDNSKQSPVFLIDDIY